MISGEDSSRELAKLRSDYHPETWQPAWSVATVLKGLLSFMCEDADGMWLDSRIWKLLGSVQLMFFWYLYSTWRRCGYILCSRNSFDEHFFQTNWHLQVILDGPHDVFFVQSWIVCFRWTNIGVGDLTCTLRRRPRRLVPFIHHHRVKWGPSSPSFAFPATIRKRPTGFFLVPESPG